MNVTIRMTGTTGLLCHSGRLVDPDDPIVQEIAAINAKGKGRTQDDRHAVERLEWFGGMYTSPDHLGPVMPTANIRKCIVEAAKITKKGKAIERALAFHDLNVPIAYDGPRDLDQLFANPAHHHRTTVRIGTSRVMRVRPQFPHWAIVADAVLLEDVLDLVWLQRIVEQAGLSEGLGDNRRNGYGRFVGEVVAR